MSEELLAFFRRIPLFSTLSTADSTELLSCVSPRTVSSGERVFRQDEENSHAYVVERGRVEISIRVDGAPHVLAELGPGEVFGETLLITGGAHSATARAVTDVDLLCIERAGFEQLRRELRPAAFEVMRQIAKVLAQRINATDREIDQVATQSTPDEHVARSWIGRFLSGVRR